MAGAAVLEDRKKQADQKASAPQAGFAWPEFWKLFFVGLLGIGMSALALYVFSPVTFHMNDDLPVGLRSPLRADYSADPANLVIEPLAAHLFADVMVDNAEPGENPAVPLATLVEQMLTPVPAVTTVPGATARPQQTLLPTRTSAPASTATRAVPSATRTQAAATLTLAVIASPTASSTPTLPPVIVATAALTARPPAAATPTTFRPSPTSVTIKTKVPTAVPPTRIPPQPTAKPPAPTTKPPEPPPAYP